MVNKPIYLAASLLAILSVIAISSSGNYHVFAAEVKIHINPGASTTPSKESFSPNPAQAKVGDKVEWINDDGTMHTITSGKPTDPDKGKLFDSGFSGPHALTKKGDEFDFTFTKPGTYDYFCSLHPAMVGTIIVQ